MLVGLCIILYIKSVSRYQNRDEHNQMLTGQVGRYVRMVCYVRDVL